MSTKNALTNEGNFVNMFNTNDFYKQKILTDLGKNPEESNNWKAIKPKKKNNINIAQTEQWREYKNGSKETSPSPKTDVILRNIITDEKIKISIKSGIGRPTSADYHETNALFRLVLNQFGIFKHTKNKTKKKMYDELLILVNTLFSIWELNKTVLKFEHPVKYYKKNIEEMPPIVSHYKKYIDEMNILWKRLYTEFPGFIRNVMIECLRGSHKFGSNDGCADKLVILKNSKSVDVETIINLNNEENSNLINYCNKLILNRPFAFKSSKGKSPLRKIWIRFC